MENVFLSVEKAAVTDLNVLTASPHSSRPNLYRGEFLLKVCADLTPAEEMPITINTHLCLFG